MSAASIAEIVTGDLEWIRTHHVARFGSAPGIDPAPEIGSALADFEQMESVAWLEFHTLQQEAQQRRLFP